MYGKEAPFFGRFADADRAEEGEDDGVGAVLAVLFHTPPYQLNLTDLPAEGIDALAARLADEGYSFPGVGGPAGHGRRVRRRLGAPRRARAQLRRSERLYRLGTLTPPTPVAGPRPGGRRERPRARRALVLRVRRDLRRNERQDPDRWAESRLAYGGVTLWETPDGTPVAMALERPP